jgi:PAS domain-containing protein
MLQCSGQLEREAFVNSGRSAGVARALSRAVRRKPAGVILTTPEGHIVDCNEACARIFGFDSRETMLAHSDAWDFYFIRAEREILIDRLRTPGHSSAEVGYSQAHCCELCGRCSRAATRHIHRHHRAEESSGKAAGHHRRTVIGRDTGRQKRWDQWLVPTDSEYFTAFYGA